MCGICGILGPEAPERSAERRELVAAMRERLRHRGPDGEGEFVAPGGVLGHTRLAVIDLEGGEQPMRSADGRYVLVYNGELYNYLELRQRLIQQGVQFRTFSDTEVLLELLAREGEAALARLVGMFAFCLYDTETGAWLLARDHFGVKPLYWTQVGEELLFASEIKALLVHPAVRVELDWHGLEEYLTFQFCLGDRTLFAGIRKLEPGTLLRGRGGEVQQHRRWWTLSFEIDETHTELYFVDRVRSLVEDSVRLQIRSDVPLGAYLSGGIDSTLVATLAAQHLPGPIPGFHGRFAEGPQYDESAYAEAGATAAGIELLVTTPTAEAFVEELPRLIWALDEPVAGPGLFPQYMVSKLAREHVKVVLGGQGGDELFCGYARYLLGYLEQALKGAIFRTTEEGRHIVTLSSIVDNLPILQQYVPLLRHFWSQGLFEPMDRRYFWLINRAPQVESLLTDDARARLDLEGVYERFTTIFQRADTRSYINKMQAFDLQTLLPALLQIEDRVSMAVSLESRVPLLDHRLAELVATVPPAVKFRGGRTKHLLRSAVQAVLPPEILERRDKMGFPVPLPEWSRREPVRSFLHDLLTDRRARERGLFAPEALERLLDPEAAVGRRLWGALSLELWFRAYLDG